MNLLTRTTKFIDKFGAVDPTPPCGLSLDRERKLRRLNELLGRHPEPEEAFNLVCTLGLVGPAGSGKTTLLSSLVDHLAISGEIFEEKNSEEEFLVVSFSRAAAKAFRLKSHYSADSPKTAEPVTIYSLAHKVLSKVRTEPIKYLDKDHLAELKLMQIDLKLLEDFDSPGFGSQLQMAFDLIRQAGVSPAEAASKISNLKISPADLGRLFETYENYLSTHDLFDHAKLLEAVTTACHYFQCPPKVFVDEAQDFTPLEWKAFDAISHKAEIVVLCGDPAQSINGWRGASVSDFTRRVNEADVRRQLVRVYRHGPDVAGYSEEVLQRVQGIPHRQPVEPKGPEGAVIPVESLSGVCNQIQEGERTWGLDDQPEEEPENDSSPFKTWLILGRNRQYLRKAAEVLDDHGIIYGSSGSLKLLLPEEDEAPAWMRWNGPRLADGIRALFRLAQGDLTDMILADVLLELLPREVWKDEKKPDSFNFRHLTEQAAEKILFGTGFDLLPGIKGIRAERIQRWFHLDPELLGHELMGEGRPRVKLSTIHGSKGLEADHVVVLGDWSKRSRKALDDPAGDEHRLGYTAVTRAKERLFLASPFQGKGYQFPPVRLPVGGRVSP